MLSLSLQMIVLIDKRLTFDAMSCQEEKTYIVLSLAMVRPSVDKR